MKYLFEIIGEYFKVGGPVMWVLLFCSISSMTVIMERTFFWSRLGLERDLSASDELLEHLRNGCDIEVMPGAGYVCQVLLAGARVPYGICVLAMETRSADFLNNFRRGMGFLDTIITASPMLGILGTVIGIMSSFDVLGSSGSSDHQAVVAGLAQALVTTAFGLGISIATVFPYNYFGSRITEMAFLFEKYGNSLEIIRASQQEDTDNAC